MTYRGNKNYTEDQLRQLVEQCTSKGEMLKSLKLPSGGTYGYRVLNYFLDLYNIDTCHFLGQGAHGLRATIPLESI